jgi:hypothetical protein
MPILAQVLTDRINSRLDSEGSQRYLFDLDIKPAINGAIETLVTSLNEAFASNKLSPECLRELVKVKVWQTNAYSRFSYSDTDTGHPLWSILAIYPKPVTNRGTGSGSTSSDKSQSKFRSDLSFVRSDNDAKRLTLEEWNVNALNVFMPGNNLLKTSLMEYAYLDPADYTSTSYNGNPGKIEITIRPEIPHSLVAMAYVKYPTNVNAVTDSIEFPQSLTDLIVDISLNLIAVKENDGVNLWQTSATNMTRLINLLK